MGSLTGVHFRHLSHHDRLDRLFRSKVETIVQQFFHANDYQVVARFNLESAQCSLEVDLHVFSKKMHIIIKKVRGSFGEAVSDMASALRESLGREKKCRQRQTRRGDSESKHIVFRGEPAPEDTSIQN